MVLTFAPLFLSIQLLQSVILALWSNEIAYYVLSKVVQRVRNYMHLDFYKVWMNIRGLFVFFVTVLTFAPLFLSVQLLQSVILALWSNEIAYYGLSKVVQRVRNYMHLDFCKVWMNICGAIRVFRNGTDFRTTFSIRSVTSERILALWSNEIAYYVLIKVVQRVRNYMHLDFYKVWMNIRGAIRVFRNGTDFRTTFSIRSVTSERNFGTLVK